MAFSKPQVLKVEPPDTLVFKGEEFFKAKPSDALLVRTMGRTKQTVLSPARMQY